MEITKTFSLLFLLSLPAFSIPVFAAHQGPGDHTYRFGVVPQFEQRKLFRIWRPILDEIEKRTGLRLHLIGSPKIPTFEKEYQAGKHDFAYMNPYHSIQAHNRQGYLPLVRDGSRELKGVLVTGKESGIDKIEDLNGKIIAFPAPNALGASLMMRADLVNLHGIQFVPRYVKTHSSVYLHVAMGLTDAGGGVASTLRSQKREIREKLKVLYETRPIPPHPIVVHPRVPREDREKVRQALLDMAATEEGNALLSKIPMYGAISAGLEDYRVLETWGLEEFWVE